jgi:L-threonylcarbamoyladenylate synthase
MIASNKQKEGCHNVEKQKWNTKHWVVHNSVDNSVDNLIHNPQVQEAARWIEGEEVVAFPTETVYGLGANALSDKATRKIFEAKGRPSDNPLIVHIADAKQLTGIVDIIPEQGKRLMEAFWPGPLTLVLPKGDQVCEAVTAGLSTVAVRMPSHPLALALIKACGLPLAAPSANRSGKPSPTQAEHVLHDLTGRIVGVLDGGETGVGLESTVIDVTGDKPMILRPGGITKEQLEAVLGEVLTDPTLSMHDTQEAMIPSVQPKSPGVKYQHYAPEGEMWLVSLDLGIDEMRGYIQQQVEIDRKKGLKVAVLTTEEALDSYSADLVLSVGSRQDLSTVARQIYHSLRVFDQNSIQRIYAESFPEIGLGEAIMNRLRKAAGGKIIKG